MNGRDSVGTYRVSMNGTHTFPLACGWQAGYGKVLERSFVQDYGTSNRGVPARWSAIE